MLSLQENFQTVPFYTPTSSVGGVRFLHIRTVYGQDPRTEGPCQNQRQASVPFKTAALPRKTLVSMECGTAPHRRATGRCTWPQCEAVSHNTRVRNTANPTSTQDGKVPTTSAPRHSKHINGMGTLETVPANTCPAVSCLRGMITDKESSLPVSGSLTLPEWKQWV